MEKEFRKIVRKTLEENYPAGANLRSDAPWKQNPEYSKPKTPKTEEFSVESLNTTEETAILKNNNDGSQWVFYYGDISKEDLSPYAEIEKIQRGKGKNVEFEEGEWEVNGDVISKYVNDNLENLSMGSGQDDFEAGKQLVKIDESMKS